VEVSFAVPSGSLEYWQGRFEELDVEQGIFESCFGETTVPFEDPHGLHPPGNMMNAGLVANEPIHIRWNLQEVKGLPPNARYCRI